MRRIVTSWNAAEETLIVESAHGAVAIGGSDGGGVDGSAAIVECLTRSDLSGHRGFAYLLTSAESL